MTEANRTEAAGNDIRPKVPVRKVGSGVWLFAGGLTVAASMLFYALENRRQTVLAPTTRPSVQRDTIAMTDMTDLVIPPQYETAVRSESFMLPRFGGHATVRPASALESAPPPPAMRRALAPETSYQLPAPAFRSPSEDKGPITVFNAPAAQEAGQAPLENRGSGGKERVNARRFDNPATTVPKGTVIQAVLESALDSTRAGFARAIISRDVFSFDGSRILVPKGSRLIGEYKADLAPGQKRALIQWQRLMRPDGVVIEIDSPTADPLGRAGVGGKVDTHFLERFSGAILQSTLDIGVQLATRSIERDAVIFALPGSTQGIVNQRPDSIPPTLKVRQGTSVSVFVARDLDFTSVGP